MPGAGAGRNQKPALPKQRRVKHKPRIGLSGELRFTVALEHAIDFTESGMPVVLSTPWLIKLLERTARECLLPLLEDGERSVGVTIELHHMAPTPLGQAVTCTARVIGSDDTLISFQVEARDEHELIARGHHQRQVIRVERFAQRVRRKQP